MATDAGTKEQGQSVDLEWNDLALLMSICRAGSLSGAARASGLNHSTIFRKLNAIEAKTGVRFFDRLPDGYAMTEAGEAALQAAERVENEMQMLGRDILGRDRRLQGKIRMTAPEGLALTLLPAMLADFHRANPDVSVELIVSSAPLDLTRREADVALRVTRTPPDTSLGRRVCDFGNNIYASPDYLKSNPDRPLAEHDWIMSEGSIDFITPMIWKTRTRADPHIVLVSNSIHATIKAAEAGMGLVFLPSFLGDPDPDLTHVPHTLGDLGLELWILTHLDLRKTARVKALMAWLHRELGTREDLFRDDTQ